MAAAAAAGAARAAATAARRVAKVAEKPRFSIIAKRAAKMGCAAKNWVPQPKASWPIL